MEVRPGGAVEQHYLDTFSSVVLYLKTNQFEELSKDRESGINLWPPKEIRKQFGLKEKGTEVERPEILHIYRLVEKWGQWVDGGYSQQPHYLQRDLEMCHSAVLQYETVDLPKMLEVHRSRMNDATRKPV